MAETRRSPKPLPVTVTYTQKETRNTQLQEPVGAENTHTQKRLSGRDVAGSYDQLTEEEMEYV